MTSSLRDQLAAVLRRPTWPLEVEREAPHRRIGLDYATDWARTPPARLARALIADNISRPLARLIAAPTIYGEEVLGPIAGPAVFVANHQSHLDTAVVLAALPARFRHHCVVAAAADYFFDRTWKATLWSLVLGAVPFERTRVNRRSTDLAAELVDDGWSLLIFPEGGRSEDGWGQEFSGSAAYLARRCEVPIVPIHLRGMRPILAKGANRLRPGSVEIRYGHALRPGTDASGREESARRFSERIEAAIALLADEAETDWWTARRRARAGGTPSYAGPEVSSWRRSWALPESARADASRRKAPSRSW